MEIALSPPIFSPHDDAAAQPYPRAQSAHSVPTAAQAWPPATARSAHAVDGGGYADEQVAAERQTLATSQSRFAAMYRATHASVLSFVSRRLIPRDFTRAEEITHDTYLVAWRKFSQLPDDEAAARAWLFTTARHLLLKSNDRHQRENRKGELGVRISEEALGFVPALHNQVSNRGLQIDLMSAWSKLTPAEQEVISLTYWDELSSAEAGQVMGISDRLYRQKLHRARTKLKKLLDG